MQKIQHLVSVDEYARLCGVPKATIFYRVKHGLVCYITINGHHFIDPVISPPAKRLVSRKAKRCASAQLPPGLDKRHLITVKKYARGKQMRCDSLYEAIILGQLQGYIIGETIFIDKADEALNNL